MDKEMLKKYLQKGLPYAAVALISMAITAVIILTVMAGAMGQTKLEVLESLILEKFVGEADPIAMGDAAAEAMVDSLGDRWSYYIPASRYGQYTQQMNNAYVGIGITISVREEADGFTVDAVEQGGPAAEAGLLPGDILIGAEGQSVVGMDINGVSEIIRGDEGTGVTVTVRRGEEELTFTMERRQIKVIVATGRLLEGNVGLVTIENFDERCAEETIAVIESLLEQGATSLLFDVRYNPGGYKRELVKVLDYLLPEGPLFRSQYYDGAEIVDSSDAKCLDVPMAVLVNGSSYSAAEFFAAAIREYEAGFVVGTQTCGKGYFQNTMELPDGSAVGLSVGKYTTPNGVCLADVGGLTPDVVVEVDDETAAKIYAGTLEPENDPQIQAALEKLKQ
jgi:carboxyl-terminal processing protease